MISSAPTPEMYLESLAPDRKEIISVMRDVIKKSLPPGFEECISYGMLGYVVPLSTYPAGYHCDPKLPLPFINLGSQKNHISLYHMGLYANPTLLNWFTTEWPKHSQKKLDMGKACIRFKKPEDVPIQLIGELCSKITVQKWIEWCEKVTGKR